MNPIHGNSQTFMRFLRDRTIRHSAGFKPRHDRIYALHFFNRNPFFRISEIQKRADLPVIVLPVYQRGILFKQFIISFSRRLLQKMDRPRIVQMLLSGTSLLVQTQTVKRRCCLQPKRIKCRRMKQFHLLFDLF